MLAELPARNVLVVFLQHGLDGSAADFDHFATTLNLQFNLLAPKGSSVFVWKSNTNKGRTMDGLVELSTRSLAEFEKFWRREIDAIGDSSGDEPVRVSVALVGHSMGGLICRYMARSLLNGQDGTPGLFSTFSEKWGTKLEILPLLFMTVSTPHLGITRPTTSTPLGGDPTPSTSAYTRILGGMAKQVASMRMGLSGKELLVADDPIEPMLLKLCRPPFASALQLFRNRTVVGSTCNDIVPYSSATIRSANPYVKESEYRVRFEAQGLEVAGWSGFDPRTCELYEKHMREVLEWGDLATFKEKVGEAMPKSETPKNEQKPFAIPLLETEPIGTRHYCGEPLPMPVAEVKGVAFAVDKRSSSFSISRLLPFASKPVPAVSSAPILSGPQLATKEEEKQNLDLEEATAIVTTLSIGEQAPSLDVSSPLPIADKLLLAETTSAHIGAVASTQLLEPIPREPSDGDSTLVGRPGSAPPRSVSSNSIEMGLSVPPQLTTDVPPGILFPPQLIIAAQACFTGAAHDFRRISLTLSITTHPMLFFMQVHPMTVGKSVLGVPRDVIEVGWRSADLLARVIVVDFLLAL